MRALSYGLGVATHVPPISLQVTKTGAEPWYERWPEYSAGFCGRFTGKGLPSNHKSWVVKGRTWASKVHSSSKATDFFSSPSKGKLPGSGVARTCAKPKTFRRGARRKLLPSPPRWPTKVSTRRSSRRRSSRRPSRSEAKMSWVPGSDVGLLRGRQVRSETCCSESGRGSVARVMLHMYYIIHARLWRRAVTEQRDKGRDVTVEGITSATLEQQ